MDDAPDLSTRIKSVKDGMLDFKCCGKDCSNQKKFNKSTYKWSNFCSRKCSLPSTIQNTKKTMFKRYGTSSYLGSKKFKDNKPLKNNSQNHITNFDKWFSKDFIEDEAIPQIKEAIRRGADIGIG